LSNDITFRFFDLTFCLILFGSIAEKQPVAITFKFAFFNTALFISLIALSTQIPLTPHPAYIRVSASSIFFTIVKLFESKAFLTILKS